MKKNERKRLFEAFPPTDMAEWKAKVEADLKGRPFESLFWKPEEGLEIPPLLRADSLQELDPELQSLPGEFPFRRGNLFNQMDRGWQLVQEISVDREDLARKRMEEALAAGVQACKLYSWEGHAPGSLFSPILEQFDFRYQALHLFVSYDPLSLLKNIRHQLQERGLEPTVLTGTLFSLGVDTGRFPRESVLELMESSPSFRPLGIDLSVVDENGGTLSQQLAFALSRTVDVLTQTSASPERILRAMAFTFPTGSDFLLEVAKLRAFRMLFARLTEVMGIDDPELQSPFVLAQSSRWNKSRYDKYNNFLRLTTEALSAVLGGAHGVIVAAYDKLLNPETAFSARMARNLQHLLRHEAYLDQVADPAGGSYYIEYLTEVLAEKAWKTFQEVEAEGGYQASLLSGKIDQMLLDPALQKQEALALRKKVFVGINNYPNSEEVLGDDLRPEDLGDEGPTAFEKLRLGMDRWAEEREKRPTAYYLTYGDVRMRNARKTFSQNLLGCGGFSSVESSTQDQLDVALNEIAELQPELVVLCAADTDYGLKEIEAVKKAAPEAVVVIAGKPLEGLAPDFWIHARMNALEGLAALQQQVMAK
jgi:methylmalonyl-CoA mutase